MRQFLLLLVLSLSFCSAQKRKASDTFQQGIELTQQADSLITLGKYKEAIMVLNNAIIKTPDNYTAYLLRAQSKYILKDYTGAFQDYKSVLMMNLGKEDNQALAYANLGIGTCYNRAKNYLEAIRYLKAAKAIDSTDTRTYDGLAYSYFSLTQFDDALVELNALLKINPQHKEAYLSRGIAFLFKKQYQSAIADFDRALALDAGYIVAYHNRGKAKKALGDKAGCCQDWHKCYALGMESIEPDLKTVCD
ncbi:tetratricopeptide repeat protein [Spirosoma sp. HMF4905]|uniref:Tetratricopeptide repeat protein n=1 Tax=Spirosoma arboris TaxID=2682092 RepID=A0A7K1SEV1_9BACT|nr:tetratricopeptide repeat protein [Spirosoma arboris]MVM32332.1 tetratricopeptide repeat protein [Spirosoma arboris]